MHFLGSSFFSTAGQRLLRYLAVFFPFQVFVPLIKQRQRWIFYATKGVRSSSTLFWGALKTNPQEVGRCLPNLLFVFLHQLIGISFFFLPRTSSRVLATTDYFPDNDMDMEIFFVAHGDRCTLMGDAEEVVHHDMNNFPGDVRSSTPLHTLHLQISYATVVGQGEK
eukprot:gene8091-5628_t